MKNTFKSTVSFTCRVRVDVMEQIRESAIQQKISQSAVITKALECMANEHTSETPTDGQNINLTEDLRRQLTEKDELINKLVSNQTELIRQNDQSQQLLASFSLIGEGAKLLEHGKQKKKQKKQDKEIDRTSSKEGSTTQKGKKKPENSKKKGKKKKK